MKPIRTWILIANSEHARIVENDGPGKGIFQPAGHALDSTESLEFADRNGRSFSSATPSRSKMEPHHGGGSPADLFAQTLADHLNKSLKKGRFERLILCAPPAMLGKIRKHFPQPLTEITLGEIPKDLTRLPTDGLSEHFDHLIAT